MSVKIDLNLEQQVTFKEHRCGWGFALKALEPLHEPGATLLDGFLEHSHSWGIQDHYNNGIVPYDRPWIGFVHNPPNTPIWFDRCHSPKIVFNREVTKKSMENCVGLFTLSNYLREFVEQLVSVPINSLVHPTNLYVPKFSMRRWCANRKRKVISVGYWMRKMHSIEMLPLEQYEKMWLITSEYATSIKAIEAKTFDTFQIVKGYYTESQWVHHDRYDKLLASNIVFVDLYDVSACNTVLECIARDTPILTNPHPANIEYLGPDYPFYFDDLDEAATKAMDDDLILETHEYLTNMDKDKFTTDHFVESFKLSDIVLRLSD